MYVRNLLNSKQQKKSSLPSPCRAPMLRWQSRYVYSDCHPTLIPCDSDALSCAQKFLQKGEYAKAYAQYEEANASGEFGSAYAMGLMTKYGVGCAKSPSNAYHLFHQSMQRGHSAAGYECAMILHNMDTQQTSPLQDATAFRLFLLAVKGTVRCPPVLHACCMVGECYLQGRGVAQDYARAMAMFLEHRRLCYTTCLCEATAARRARSSVIHLGFMFQHGLGTPCNADKANEMFIEAALGDVDPEDRYNCQKLFEHLSL